MAELRITGVTIRRYKSEDDKLRAFASIIIDEVFVVKDLKIIEGSTGRFIAMPSRRGKGGVFHDIAHPLNQATRDQIERMVLKAYEEDLKRDPDGGDGNADEIQMEIG